MITTLSVDRWGASPYTIDAATSFLMYELLTLAFQNVSSPILRKQVKKDISNTDIR